MDISKPIILLERLQLSNLGVQPTSISSRTLSLESDRFICVREQNQVVIVDLADANNVLRKSITADSAIMHPHQKIMALRSGRTLQILNIETGANVKSHANAEDVTFWKWISDNTVGIVTETAVYHWSTADTTSPPQKVFDRHPTLVGAQIINYRCSADEKWLVLVGIAGNTTSPLAFKIKGSMQLYSRDRGVSQPIEGHAAAFAEVKLEGHQNTTKLFTFSVRTGAGAKLYILEIDHQAPDPVFTKKQIDVYFPPEATNDFPVAMQVSKKHGIVYLVTKYGFIHLYDLESGACIYMNRISGEAIFVSAEHEASHGIIIVGRNGQVLSVEVDENTIIPYILTTLNNTELAFKLASRANLPGAEVLYVQQYQQLFHSGQFDQAARVAANSPRGILRTAQVIEQFKQAPIVPGGQSPILRYLGILLEKGQLNHLESVELSRPVLEQGKEALFEKWLKEGKLTCSEELGDMVRLTDIEMALSVYLRANVPKKVIACFAEMGQPEKILLHAKEVGYTPDYASLLQHIMRTNPDKGAEFAAQLANDESGPLVDIERVVDIFMSQDMIHPATTFLLDVLKDNKPEQGHLQTRLLEMNLIHTPQIADAIFSNDMFTHYDRPRIANLCEKVGLLQRALEHYDDLADIKRVVVHTNAFKSEWLVEYFGRLTADQSIGCMQEMLRVNIRQNLPVVIQIATKYSDTLGSDKLMETFEPFGGLEGLNLDGGGSTQQPKNSQTAAQNPMLSEATPHLDGEHSLGKENSREYTGGSLVGGNKIHVPVLPPPPMNCFSREETVDELLDLTDQVASVALFGTIGVGKSCVALTLLHHNQTKARFGQNRYFLNCDDLKNSVEGFLESLSGAIWAKHTTSITQLRLHLVSSPPLLLLLEGIDLILDQQTPESEEISATIEEFGSYNNVCLVTTSRIYPEISGFHRVEVPVLSEGGAQNIFYSLCNLGRSSAIDNIISKLDFHPLSIDLLASAVHENAWDEAMLLKAWDDDQTSSLRIGYYQRLKEAIEPMLDSPKIKKLGTTALDVLELIAAFPSGVEEGRLQRRIPGTEEAVDVLCKSSLIFRQDGFVKMFSPFQLYFLESMLQPTETEEVIHWGADCMPAQAWLPIYTAGPPNHGSPNKTPYPIPQNSNIPTRTWFPTHTHGPPNSGPSHTNSQLQTPQRKRWIGRMPKFIKRLIALLSHKEVPIVIVDAQENPADASPPVPEQQNTSTVVAYEAE